MKRLGMRYCYSYEELWQPKNFKVVFRMYQYNLDGEERVFRDYWDAGRRALCRTGALIYPNETRLPYPGRRALHTMH